MEIKVNKINSANAEIYATISAGEIDAKINKIAKGLTKTAKVDGFRKGKVPVATIKKQYGSRLVQDAESEALRTVFDNGLKELNIAPDTIIGEPNISRFDKTAQNIEVTVKIAMRPFIDLGDYVSMVADFEKPVVSDEAVDVRIKNLAEQQASLIDVEEDREVQNGDTVIIDFAGSIDGVAFTGGTSTNFAFKLGSNQFIPGFEEQVIGMKKDEEKVIQVTFPQNYNPANLAGKDSDFKVKVHKIQVQQAIEINDEFAAKMLQGEEKQTLEHLKALVKTQLENEELSKLYNDLKPVLLEIYVENIKFDLPDFVVEQEIDIALNKKAGEMSETAVQELRDNPEKLTELRESFREDARKSVSATFLIDSLAQAQNIRISEQEVLQTIYFEAIQIGQDPQAAYEKYKKAGYLPAVQMSMVEDKVLTVLLNTKIKEA